MFVDNVELVQSPQVLKARIVPSVIRLQRLDFVLRRRREFIDLSRAATVELAFGSIDREFNPGVSGLRSGRDFQLSESAGKVVKGAAEVMDSVSNDHGKGVRDRWIESKLGTEVRGWYAITDSLQSAWIGRPLGPAVDLGIKGVEVFLRPIDLELYAIWNHRQLFLESRGDVNAEAVL
jgi:hypothetical protein